MKRWEATCQDCRRALDIDANQVKGHFFLGQALVELECYDEAIKHLHRGRSCGSYLRGISNSFFKVKAPYVPYMYGSVRWMTPLTLQTASVYIIILYY